MKKMVMAAGLLMAVSAFAQFGGFGGPQGGGSVPDADKTADVNYAGDGKTYHTLDIYIPKQAKESYPVVIHTKAGYAVVTPNHRSASDAKYPAQLHDIKAVVRFVRGNAAKYKFDTNFVAVSGFSSGGHLSSLTATTCGLKEGKSGSVTVDLVGDLGEFTSFSSCVDGAVLWSPPTDIYTMNPISMGGSGTMEGAFIGVEREGNKDKWMVASSPYYASDDDPPVIEQSQELYDSLKNHNVVTEFVKVSGGSHGGDKMNSSENLAKAVAFLDQAREAKAAAVVVPPDTTTQDTSKQDTSSVTPPDTSKQDSSITALPVLRSLSMNRESYRVYSLDGTLVMKSSTLDLSRLNPGVYYVESATRNGSRRVFRYAKR